MMQKIKNLFVIFSLFLCLSAGVVAQSIDDTPEIQSLYSKGKRYLRQGDFYEAGQTFSELEGRFPDSKILTSLYFTDQKQNIILPNMMKLLQDFHTL